MSSVCAKIRLLTLSPSLGDGIVDNALLQTTPDVNQSRPEFVDIVDTRLLSSVHTSNMSKQQTTCFPCFRLVAFDNGRLGRSTYRRKLNMFSFFRFVVKNCKNRSTCCLRLIDVTYCFLLLLVWTDPYILLLKSCSQQCSGPGCWDFGLGEIKSGVLCHALVYSHFLNFHR